ncbi:MAG: hypothetical protein LIO90_10745 [Bacteroidales bacterium]|nr:hypothetical protein [Bacteroidales bacterium]
MKKQFYSLMAALALTAVGANAAEWVEPTVGEYYGSITLTWPDDYEVAVNDDAIGYAYINNEQIDLEAADEALYAMDNVMYLISSEFADGVTVYFYLPSSEYTLTVDGDAVEVEDIEFTYTIGEGSGSTATEFAVTSSYADGVVSFVGPAGYGIELRNLSEVGTIVKGSEQVATIAKSDVSVAVASDYSCTVNVTIPDEVLEAAGVYTVTISASSYNVTDLSTLSDVASIDLVYELTIGGAAEVSFSGTYAEGYVMITYTGYRALVNDNAVAYVYAQDDLTTPVLTVEEINNTISGGVIASVETLPAGDYTIVIPASAVTLYDSDDNEVAAPEVSYDFTVEATTTGEAYEYTVVPSPEAPVLAIGEVVISGNRELAIADKSGMNKWYGYDPREYDVWTNATLSEDLLSVSFTFQDFNTGDNNVIFTAPGFYQLYIGAEDMYVTFKSGSGFPVINVLYQIEGDLAYTLTNNSETGQVSSVTIEFPRFSSIAVNEDCLEGVRFLNKTDGAAKDIDNITFSTTDYYVRATLSVNEPITAKGEYQLVVPADYFTLGWKPMALEEVTLGNQEITADFAILTTGIQNITLGEGRFDVYNMQGICVKRNATNYDLEGLGRGVYIINGQKVAVLK